MKKAFRKNLWREIRKTKSRFFSLIAITAIGVAMFTGVRAATPTMLRSVDDYFQKQNVSNIRIMNFKGINQDDIDLIDEKINDVHFELGYLFDAYIEHDQNEIVARGITYQKMNMPYLISGRLLENNQECLISQDYPALLNETITIKNSLKEQICQVVGIVESPLNFGKMYKGANSLGAGQTQAIVFLTNSDAEDFAILPMFKMVKSEPIYNMIDLQFEDLKNDSLYSKSFNEKVVEKEAILKDVLSDDFMIQTVLDNDSVKIFKEDASNIQNIAAVFPIVFFIVAALVSLTTMTRMIDEKRLQIGILKAQGYSRFTIMMFYCIYAFIAALIGVVLGLVIGYTIIPPAVLMAYSRIYILPKMVLDIDVIIGMIASILALVIILGATIISALSSLRLYPAELLRPKSPPEGKRIFLEHLPWLWKRLNFTNKVTARNILRYKKRFFMSVFGIMGCTSLLITALGIQTSVEPIRSRQFSDIYQYQMTVYTDSFKGQGIEDDLLAIDHVESILPIYDRIIDYNFGPSKQLIHIISPSDSDLFENYVVLKKGKERLSLDDYPVIMTFKLAESLKLKVGDNFVYKDGDDEYNLKISAITDFYIGHSVFVNQSYFNHVSGKDTRNAFYLKTNSEDKQVVDEAINQIGEIPSVKLVNSGIDVNQMVKDSISGIDYIIWVMIGFAGVLALVVMYNLTTINIAERNRELATIKVLGFYNLEVAQYVYKENTVLTLIGIIVGVIIGTPLHQYIIKLAEPNTIYFLRHLVFMNYVYAFVITFAFSMIINILMYYRLVKIDMVESLKSVE